MSNLVIRGDQPTLDVLVDGFDYAQGLTGLDMKLRSGQPCALTLHLAIFDDLDTEHHDVEVILPPETVDVLLALGWRPPPTPGENATAVVDLPHPR